MPGKLQTLVGVAHWEKDVVPIAESVDYAISSLKDGADTETVAISLMTLHQHHKNLLRQQPHVFMVSLLQAFFNPEIEIILV